VARTVAALLQLRWRWHGGAVAAQNCWNGGSKTRRRWSRFDGGRWWRRRCCRLVVAGEEMAAAAAMVMEGEEKIRVSILG